MIFIQTRGGHVGKVNSFQYFSFCIYFYIDGFPQSGHEPLVPPDSLLYEVVPGPTGLNSWDSTQADVESLWICESTYSTIYL